jgi:hypothetical protein
MCSRVDIGYLPRQLASARLFRKYYPLEGYSPTQISRLIARKFDVDPVENAANLDIHGCSPGTIADALAASDRARAKHFVAKNDGLGSASRKQESAYGALPPAAGRKTLLKRPVFGVGRRGDA